MRRRTPANYYDNVMGFYALYYRTGNTTYLEAARKLADRFWTSPTIDRGAACGIDTGAGCFAARAWSSLGLVLRALDGRPDMWPGLRILGATSMYILNAWKNVWDIREQAYYLSTISYLALFDPDADSRSQCKAAISASFANIWTPHRAADGSWPAPYYSYASWTPTLTSVTLTSGSVSVKGEGTNWTASAVDGKTIWFTNAPGQPASNAEGDAVTYTARFVSPTDLILDRPYEGAEGTHGWMVAPTTSAIGLGAQPFMMGILGTAFDFAAQAVADSDPATAALARGYIVDAANWIKTYGYWPLRKGTHYFAQFVNCQAPIADTNHVCTSGGPAATTKIRRERSTRRCYAPIGLAYLVQRRSGAARVRGHALLGDVFETRDWRAQPRRVLREFPERRDRLVYGRHSPDGQGAEVVWRVLRFRRLSGVAGVPGGRMAAAGRPNGLPGIPERRSAERNGRAGDGHGPERENHPDHVQRFTLRGNRGSPAGRSSGTP